MNKRQEAAERIAAKITGGLDDTSHVDERSWVLWRVFGQQPGRAECSAEFHDDGMARVTLWLDEARLEPVIAAAGAIGPPRAEWTPCADEDGTDAKLSGGLYACAWPITSGDEGAAFALWDHGGIATTPDGDELRCVEAPTLEAAQRAAERMAWQIHVLREMARGFVW